jgi:hypothetical protein
MMFEAIKVPRVPAPKVTMAAGLISGWLIFQKTKAGNARKRYASSPTSTRVVLKRLTNVITERDLFLLFISGCFDKLCM